MQSESLPISTKWLLRGMVVLIVIFSLMAGYYQSRLYVWQNNNRMILEKFGVNTTQELLKKKVEVQ
ncbi:hypothetical protein H3C66_03225 [Patescibacteria group bacterium]|nr:hypothetical protein [Patescibacteria group bacterium]